MLASPAMEMQTEETPLALQRLWNLTRARLAGTSTALDVEPALVENLPSAQVKKHDINYLVGTSLTRLRPRRLSNYSL